MQAVEFRTSVENGTIQIPKEFRNRIRGQVRVILLTDEAKETRLNMIDQLLEHPLKIDDFVPLRRNEIYERQ